MGHCYKKDLMFISGQDVERGTFLTVMRWVEDSEEEVTLIR
jgi:hypothetical protein